MFSSVCQGLQLCLEPRIVEAPFFRLNMSPSPINLNSNQPGAGITDIDDNNDDNECKPIVNQNTDIGGWSFLQSLACSKSSETGSEVSDRSNGIPFLLSETDGFDTSKPREKSATRRMSRRSNFPPPLTSIGGSTVSYIPLNTRRTSRSSSFPPPLTSISGSNGVQVTSHREGGRLVVQAVSAPTCHTYMHAERTEGRLRLCLFKDSTTNTPISDDHDGEDEDITIPIFDDEDEGREEVAEEDEAVNEENGVVECEIEEERCHWGDEGMNVKSGNIEGRIGMGKLPRRSSCKERRCRHKGLLAWEPYLVAT
ncbi:hypothetical protein F3Y22_tig00110465pilonHSYRG00013 [Hibiscus syriacus]|uniref:FAF domain-containing protein n=1 Tax=Hibiscus syriacus TaxID=106335 RepID=A0A6A3AKC7_HIBSY|nr:hypothetical protein F3Y22_tig00110465pilonHSYRG00013 [Hibiscus syriacus]